VAAGSPRNPNLGADLLVGHDRRHHDRRHHDRRHHDRGHHDRRRHDRRCHDRRQHDRRWLDVEHRTSSVTAVLMDQSVKDLSRLHPQ
jgi:hypothetical protein